MSGIAEKKSQAESGSAALERMRSESIADLESAYEAAVARAGGQASEDPDCELLRLEIELARSERDRAGALKFKSFVRRNRELFLPAEDGEGGKGYRLAPGAESRRYLFVSMGELDRLNKEGHGQAAGDAGLEAVVHAAAEAAGSRPEGISVYRYGGNEYVVEFAAIDEASLLVCEERFRRSRLDLGAFRHLEPPPLSFARLDFSEVADIMDSAELSEPGKYGKDAYEAAAESVSTLTRLADYQLEAEKFETRISRAVDKLRAAAAGEIADGDAKDFFDAFLKKGFVGSGIDSIADVADLWHGGEDSADFARSVRLLAADAARRRFADDRENWRLERHLVDGAAREYLRTQAAEERRSEAEYVLDDGLKLAKIPDRRYGTEGLRTLSRLQAQIGRRSGKWAEVDRLAYESEAMKRDAVTGLLEREQFYDDIEGRLAAGEAVSLIFVDLGYLKYFNDAGRRAVGDAAVLKAAEVMEEGILRSDEDAKAYRYGGDEFVIAVSGGAAEAEKVKREIELARAEAGRIPDLRSLRAQGQAADSVGDSRPDYAPMELVLNYGISDSARVGSLLNDLGPEEAERLQAGRGRSREALAADLLVKTADSAVGYQKATSRFRELLRLMARPGYADAGSLERRRTEAVIAASRKAIFSGLGGEAALRFWAEGQDREDPGVLDEQIERFVADRIEKMEGIVAGEKELVDKLVEVHAARNRLLDEVESLERKLADEEIAAKEGERKMAELRARLYEAERARQAIVEARQSVVRSAIDKKPEK